MFIAFAYVQGVSCKGIEHWNTGINQESIKLLSNLKQNDNATPAAISA